MALQKIPSELLPTGQLTTALLATALADNNNAALHLGTMFADPFDTLTSVDVAGGTNLDAGTAGMLKPTIPAVANSMSSPVVGAQVSSNVSFRIVLSAALLTVSGNFLRVVVSGPNSGTSQQIAKMYIAEKAASGDAYDYAGTPVQITFNGGSAAVTPPVGGRVTSDWIAFPIDETKSYVIGYLVGAVSGGARSFSGGAPSGYDLYFRNASGDDTTTVNTTNYGSDAGYKSTVDALQVASSIISNNLTVRSTAVAAIAAPTSMGAVFKVMENEPAIAGTDYTLEFSRDDGTTWSIATLTEKFTDAAGNRVVEAAMTNVASQPTGTNLRWRFKTLNNKNVDLVDMCFYWS